MRSSLDHVCHWLLQILLVPLVLSTSPEQPQVEDVVAFRSFCALVGPQFPLASVRGEDAQLKWTEALFWSMIYLGHPVAAESQYALISKKILEDGSGATGWAKGQLVVMEHALSGLPKDRPPPCLSCDEDLKNIFEQLATGNYCAAHSAIYRYAEHRQDELSTRLIVAKGVAQYPLATYSPATERVLLTSDLKKNVDLLTAVNCVREAGDDPTILEAIKGKKKSEMANSMWIYWTAGKWREAAEIAKALSSKPNSKKYALDADLIQAASALCSPQGDPQGAALIYERILQTSELEGKPPPRAATVGARFAKLGLTRTIATDVYSRLVQLGQLKGKEPVSLLTAPASPPVHQVIVPTLPKEIEERLVLPQETLENITRDPVPVIPTPVTDRGEVINIQDVPTEADPIISVTDLVALEGPVEETKVERGERLEEGEEGTGASKNGTPKPRTANKLWMVEEGLTTEAYEKKLREVHGGLTKTEIKKKSFARNGLEEVLERTKASLQKRDLEVVSKERPIYEFQQKLKSLKPVNTEPREIKEAAVQLVKEIKKPPSSLPSKGREPIKVAVLTEGISEEHIGFANISKFGGSKSREKDSLYIPHYQRDEFLSKNKGKIPGLSDK